MNFKKNILLVEDETITSMAQSSRLRRDGYMVVEASNAEEALTVINNMNYKFHLVLMDIDLGSGLNGIQTAKIIISNYRIPVLFLTSNDDADVVMKAKSVSPYGYYIKSVNHSTLVEAIEMALEINEVVIK